MHAHGSLHFSGEKLSSSCSPALSFFTRWLWFDRKEQIKMHRLNMHLLLRVFLHANAWPPSSFWTRLYPCACSSASSLGIHAATILVDAFVPGRTYRQLFQVDVTFAFVSADQFTLSIVMAVHCHTTAVDHCTSETLWSRLYSRFSNQPQRYKHQKNRSCTVSHRQGVDQTHFIG